MVATALAAAHFTLAAVVVTVFFVVAAAAAGGEGGELQLPVEVALYDRLNGALAAADEGDALGRQLVLGTLAHATGEEIALKDMPELEQLMLHRLAELDALVRKGYEDFDYKKVFHHLFTFMTVELSAFYFDVRKDTLYCDPASSVRRKAALQVVGQLFTCLVTWMAPIKAKLEPKNTGTFRPVNR